MALMVTEELAYVLGYLWADGWVRDDQYHKEVRLECIKEDMEEVYSTFLKTNENWKIYYRNREGRKPQARLNLQDKGFVKFLIENDYRERTKSADKILLQIPKKYQRYWFRGFVDGDGCWYCNLKLRRKQFNISSHYEQDWSFVESFLMSLELPYRVYRKNYKNKSSTLELKGGKDSYLKLGNYLYRGFEKDGIGLNRKYNKWKDIISLYA